MLEKPLFESATQRRKHDRGYDPVQREPPDGKSNYADQGELYLGPHAVVAMVGSTDVEQKYDPQFAATSYGG